MGFSDDHTTDLFSWFSSIPLLLGVTRPPAIYRRASRHPSSSARPSALSFVATSPSPPPKKGHVILKDYDVCPLCQRRMLAKNVIRHLAQCFPLEPLEDVSGPPSSPAGRPQLCCQMDTCRSSTKLIRNTGCSHHICAKCIQRFVFAEHKRDRGASVRCPVSGCSAELSANSIKESIGRSDFELLSSARLAKHVETSPMMVECVGCKSPLELPKPLPRASPLDPVTAAAFRVRCPSCTTTFCAKCKVRPFHTGTLCTRTQAGASSVRCRFCGDVPAFRVPPPDRTQVWVCKREGCVQAAQEACTVVAPCGHPCGGLKGELDCVGCVAVKCSSDPSHCSLCMDNLCESACIRLDCSHVFHLRCVQQQIAVGYPGPHISFRFLACAMCNKRLKHRRLREALREPLELLESVQRCGDEYLRSQPDSGTSLSAEMLAIRLNFYTCSMCKTPYVGGERACAEIVRPWDADALSELICGTCSSTSAPCELHGTDAFVWKCRYCCNEATHFCWGTTRFCGDCHKRAGELAAKRNAPSRDCTCGRVHPAHGVEFSFGCGLCMDKGKK